MLRAISGRRGWLAVVVWRPRLRLAHARGRRARDSVLLAPIRVGVGRLRGVAATASRGCGPCGGQAPLLLLLLRRSL